MKKLTVEQVKEIVNGTPVQPNFMENITAKLNNLILDRRPFTISELLERSSWQFKYLSMPIDQHFLIDSLKLRPLKVVINFQEYDLQELADKFVCRPSDGEYWRQCAMVMKGEENEEKEKDKKLNFYVFSRAYSSTNISTKYFYVLAHSEQEAKDKIREVYKNNSYYCNVYETQPIIQNVPAVIISNNEVLRTMD